MGRRINQKIINKIIALRQKGWSLPEIKKEVKIGHGTIYRYIKDITILPEYQKEWVGKRGGSKKRRLILEKQARERANAKLFSLTHKEKLIFLSALYWGEGTKSEFSFSNTDPLMIKIIIRGLKELLHIPTSRFKVSIRIYEDLDREKCLQFWSKTTGVPVKDIISVNVLPGKKKGKLLSGMCRVRLKKGSEVLKYIKALKDEVVQDFLKSPHSSTDRAQVS